MKRLHLRLLVLLAGLLAASPSFGSPLTDALASFDAEGAKGYLGPMQVGMGQGMNSNTYWTADIPKKFAVSLDVFMMRVQYKDEDRTFEGMAPNDPSSTPEEATASTVVGSGESTQIEKGDGSIYVFPGGFDMDWSTIAVPQLTVAILAQTELAVRWFEFKGIEDFGDIEYLGFGARHSISQYFSETFPVAIALAGWYQSMGIDNKLIETNTWSLAGNASWDPFTVLTLFGGLGYDNTSMDLSFVSEVTGASEMVDTSLDSEGTVHVTGGVTLKVAFLHANAAAEYAQRFGYSLGAGINF